MKSKYLGIVVFVLLGIVLLFDSPCFADKEYLDFETFKALVSLAPELPQALPSGGLSKEGYKAWERGELRLPITGNFFKRDLNQDGNEDFAILLKVEKTKITNHYLLIATQTKKELSRLFLQSLGEKSYSMQWDEKREAIEIIKEGEGIRVTSPATMSWPEGEATYGYVVEIRKPSYLYWDPLLKRFEYVSGDKALLSPWLLKTNLNAYEDLATEKFQSVHIKFTYIGPQMEPIPGLFLFAPGYDPNLEFFKIYYRQGLRYGNDMCCLNYVLINPEEIQKIASTIANLKDLKVVLKRNPYEDNIHFSVSILTIGDDPRFCELFLSWEETESLLSQIKEIIEKGKPPAYRTIEDYLKMF